MSRAVLKSPYFVMGVAGAMYTIKIAAKVPIGLAVNSPMVYGEGLHNVADLIIVGLGVLVMLVSTVKIKRYAHGLIKLRNFGQLITGSLLLLTAFEVGRKGLAGVLAWWPAVDVWVRGFLPLPQPEAVSVGAGQFPLLVAILGGSFLLSQLVGRWQVRVGRANRNATVTADGSETISDGYVELAVLTGILGENLLGWHWLEHPAALLVAVMLVRTGTEIIREGFDELMQKKLAPEIEAAIIKAVMSVPGVIEVADFLTYGVGHLANIEMKIRTLASATAHDELRFAIKAKLRAVLAEFDFTQSRKIVDCHKPKRRRSCLVVAIVKKGDVTVIAPTLAVANALRRVNVENGEPQRLEDYPVLDSLPALTAWLAEKRTDVFRAGTCTDEELAAIKAAGAQFEPTSSFTLDSLDL